MDELWSFVGNKQQKVWIWLASERKTRKIVGLAFGDRSAATCRRLWQSLPADYRKRAIFYTDNWQAYHEVLPKKRHRIIQGGTNHSEGFNNKLRQRCANLVRKTVSFSKLDILHQIRIRLFIEHHNLALSV